MRQWELLILPALILSGCSSGEVTPEQAANQPAKSAPQPSLVLPKNPAETELAQVESWLAQHRAVRLPEVASSDVAGESSEVRAMLRTTSDGRTVRTRELVGPDVMPVDARPLRPAEIAEIESATGRSYEEGDTIYGRGEEVEPAE